MFKIKSKKPRESYISKFKNVICPLLSFFFIALIILYIKFKNTFTSFDKGLFYITMLSQLLTLYSCFVKWSPNILMYTHYLFVIMLYIVLFSENTSLLSYYLCVVISIIIGWKLNNNVCVFDKLNWDVEIMGYKIQNTRNRSALMIYILLLGYPLKIFYSMK
jgi:hypothetical protein|uniref:Uncharacterized protein n=1 Tax=viral metagenome TaxID=1070528 RepID=A0A6C0CW86_9ZZZZ